MSTLPRLALGTIAAAAGESGRTPNQDDSAGRAAIWAVLSALEGAGVKTQSFTSRACFSSVCGAAAITGRSCRHLDSWLMPRDVCQRMFRRGMRGADLGLLEGAFSSDQLLGWHPTPHHHCGSCFETLCRWLGVPRLGILDVARLACCKLPPRPQVEGLILDGVDRRQLAYWQTTLESLWGLPVVGAIEALPQVRAALAATLPGDAPNTTLCRLLGKSFSELSSLPQLLKLANRRFSADPVPNNEDSGLWQLVPQEAGLTIAVAYDEAFQGYFPDTLDLLEEAGATVRYFSPLADEGLALEADIVYFGCGHPERFADVLAENLSLKASLRNHLQAGKRIYAEGGGLAYLCRALATPDGREYPMAGLLPATARLSPEPRPPQPVEVALAKSTWLGPAGCRLRGYLNSSWSLTASDERLGCVASDRRRLDLVSRAGAIGSRVHLNFALQPEVFQSFCRRISLAGRTV
jgi:cobyrinic acid a,c-diamide synthase